MKSMMEMAYYAHYEDVHKDSEDYIKAWDKFEGMAARLVKEQRMTQEDYDALWDLLGDATSVAMHDGFLDGARFMVKLLLEMAGKCS